MIDKETVDQATTRLERFGDAIRRRIYPIDVLIRAGKQFMNDDAMTYAAAMSYYVLFSLFPTMIFVVTVFGLVVRDPELQEQAVDAMVSVVPAGFDVRSEISAVISGISQASSPILLVVGLLGTAWTASNMFAALRRSLNLAFNISDARNFLIGRLMDMLNLPAIMLLALISVSATATVRVLEAQWSDWFRETALSEWAWTFGYFLIPYIISFLAFLMLYRVLPNARFPFRYLAIGATFSAIGFELVKSGFSTYVANFGNYQEVYGALGGVVAFLFFVFIQANVIIFGGAISAQIIHDRHIQPEKVDAEVAEGPDVKELKNRRPSRAKR
jgi:membrane protein